MTVERRRALIERIFAKAEQNGRPVEGDPRFRAWVDQWVAYEIDLDELKRRYGELLRLRSEERRRTRVTPPDGGLQVSSVGLAAIPEERQSESANSRETVLLGFYEDGDEFPGLPRP